MKLFITRSSSMNPPPISECRDYPEKIDSQDRDKIRDLAKIISEASMFTLLSKAASLRQYEVDLNHLHPLSFVETALLDPEIKSHLLEIKRKGDFIWGKFQTSIFKKLDEEEVLGNVQRHLASFSNRLSVSMEVVENFMKQRTINPLIQELQS